MKRLLVALVVVFTLGAMGACSKQHPATRGRGPAILGRIPADTPYVIAVLEPAPRAYLEKTLADARSKMTRAKEKLRALPGQQPAIRVMLALLEEMEPYLSVEKLPELGLRLDGRMALYGLGILPVARLEIGDAAKLTGFIDRVLSKGGLSARRTSDGGRTVWSFDVDSRTEVDVAVTAGELVVTLGPRTMMTAILARAVAEHPEGRSMLEDGRLQAAAGELGLSIYVGLVDTGRVLARLALDHEVLNALGAKLPALDGPCAAELASLGATSPRWAFGLSELSVSRVSGTVIMELRPELARDLQAARASVPGLGAPLGDSVASLALAADPRVVQLALKGEAERVAAVSRSCRELGPVANKARELAAALAEPIPSPWSVIRGFSVTLHSARSGLGVPQVQAFGVVAASDTRPLVDMLRALHPSVGDVPADGTPVPFDTGMPFLDNVSIGMKPGLFGASIGAGMASRLGQLLASPPSTGAVLSIALDMKRLHDVVEALAGAETAAELDGKGRTEILGELTDRGLVLKVSTVE